MDSILNTQRGICYQCLKEGKWAEKGTQRHHVLHGTGRRRIAEKLGLVVYLCPEHHQGTNGVHGKNGHELDVELKQDAQRAFEELYGHSEWMRKVGENFL